MRTAPVAVSLLTVCAVAGGAVKVLPYPDPKCAFDHTKIDRTLVEPKYGSDKPAYRFYALGPTGKTILAMVWDESKGTGAGYDTLYIDLNLNGRLTDKGEKFVGPQPAKAAGYRPMKDRADLIVMPSGQWRNRIVENRRLDVPDEKLNYTLSLYYSFTRLNISTKAGDWRFPMRFMDGGVPWGTVKAAAPVLRVGGPDWMFANDRFIQRPAGRRKKVYPCHDKDIPFARPGDKIWVDGTSSFFAGSSPSVQFRQGAVYCPWTARGFTARVEDPTGRVISHLEFHQSCGGARWATTLITSAYPHGKAVMVFDMDSGGYQGRIVQRVPFAVDNPGYGKPLPELEITARLRRASPGATVTEVYQGAKLEGLGVPSYDGARDVYFGIYGLGAAHPQSCTNVGCGISFGHDIRNELHLGGEGRRALVKFDLSLLDASAKVKQAVLALNVMWVKPKADLRTRAFAMKKRWSEIFSRDGGGLYYRGHGSPPRRFHGPWPVGGPEAWEKRMFNGDGDRHAEPIAEVTFAKPGWVGLDVTRAVRKWVGGEWANHGLGLAMVADRREYGGHDVRLRSSDFPADPRVRPCLILVLDGKAKPRPHKVGTVNDDLTAAAGAARKAGKPLLVCALSGASLTSRAFETGTLAHAELRAWLDKQFVVARIDGADGRHKDFLRSHGVRRFPSMVVMSPDPAQPGNFALIEPLDWDAPQGIFRSSFEFEQIVAKSLRNVLERAKSRSGRYGTGGTCQLSGR